MFVNALVRGGAETQFLRAAKALHAAGYDVRVFTMLDRDDFRGEHGPLPVRLLAPRPGPATVRNAIRELRAWAPDVVVSFLYQATLLGRIAAALARTPVVVSSIRNERLDSRWQGLAFRVTGFFDSVTVTNSEFAARTLAREHTVAAAKLRVIRNGVDLDLLRAGMRAAVGLRAELGVGERDFLYLGVGRLARQKDWPTLIAAAARYRGPPAKWMIAGEGADREALQAQIDAHGLADHVRLLGLRDDVPALLAASDALVLSSTYEGLPNVVLEAMACARPVVATRVGGCEELLGSDYGLLVEPREPAALAVAMADLAARDPAQRRAMGDAAQRHVHEHYALETAQQEWVELIDSLLAERGITCLAAAVDGRKRSPRDRVIE